MNITDFSLHFTEKNQDLETLKKKFREYSNNHFNLSSKSSQAYCMHHCFVPREQLKQTMNEYVCDFLDSISPRQMRWYTATTRKENNCIEMLKNLRKINGVAIFLGNINDDVAHELAVAKQAGVEIIRIP